MKMRIIIAVNSEGPGHQTFHIWDPHAYLAGLPADVLQENIPV